MEKKKGVWYGNPLRTFFSLRKFHSNFFRRGPFSKFSQGFTLIELLVAFAIIGTLASSLVFVINPGAQFAKGRDAQRKNDLEQMKNALDAYYSDYNLYPSSLSSLSGGVAEQPYIKKVPQDPSSGQLYYYEAAGDGSWYRLYAKLERCSDSQVISGIDCTASNYNYSVTSTNTSVVAFGAPTPTQFVPPPLSPTPSPTPTPVKKVFVTSQTYDGNLGGLSGADVKCQQLAAGVGFSGVFKTWLSDTTTSAGSRLSHSSIPYALVDGTVVADSWSDLTDTTPLKNLINKTESGQRLSIGDVATGTRSDGQSAFFNCSGWTNGSSSSLLHYGRLSDKDHWTNVGFTSCNGAFRLYCFEQ